MPPKAKAKAGGINRALLKQTSLVEPVDSSGQVYKGMQVWSCDAPLVKTNPDELYAKCVVLPGSTKTMLKLRQLEPEVNEAFDSANENCHNVNTGTDALSYPDIGGLPHTNSAAVLDYMRVRFLKGNIYCTADPLLVAINPFKNVGGTTQEDIAHTASQAVEKCLPHTFTIAKTAAENLINVQKSQTIIVSGESGAGKTEATKLAMRFFAFSKGSSGDSKIQEAVMGANPVLEAFGNAKTVRNDNSSRFGRFMQLQLGNRGGIMFGIVKGFLLEKSRVVMQENQERSYHIFYQMLKGMDPKEKEKYVIKGVDHYKTINSHCLDVASIDDLQEYKEVRESLNKMKMSIENQESMFSVLSGVMHLGNVTFRGDEKAEIIDETPLKLACGLLFLDFDTIKVRLLIKQSMAGGQVIESTWSQQDALMLLSSLQRAVYDALFQWIMSVLNLIIQNPEGMQVFMGMLDIFGFEVFENNSLEQLFINITNEFLQKNFVDVVFERESALYKKEGISAGDMKWTDNNEVINVLIGKRGLMTHLEDQCLAPGGNDQKVISAAFQAVGSSGKLVKAKINQAENFIVQHTIGAISYNCVGFLIKNKDVLRAEFLEPLQTSPNAVVAALFKGVVIEKGKLDKGRLIGSQYMQQLHSMIGIINSTEPHFIRCVRSNDEKKPLMFTPSKVLIQIYALSILEALQIREIGFSYRRPFEDFLYQFRFVDMGAFSDKKGNPKENCLRMLASGGCEDPSQVQVGHTMVFLRRDALRAMSACLRDALAVWEPVVAVMEALYLLYARQQHFAAFTAHLTRVQAHTRKVLAISGTS
ncbi:MAG: hypothetical protein KVP17_000767 [Porospora cf. gigantea B]|uniref:uncharacterized protein n=1 Tax=Porospora cf. gigantea B TaxID=2853592 RepID=UPI003571A3D6|nr:MAG: hypothetical protein KVP17_000767 [Porospora cf. gigantea B]